MKMRTFALLAMGLLMSTIALAQRGHRGAMRPGLPLDRLEMIIDLTEEQKEQLAAVEATTKSQLNVLRDSTFESSVVKREAVKAILEDTREQVETILTEEQKEQLQANREKRLARREMRKDTTARRNLKQELDAYRNENIHPVMLAQRAKLEEILTAEDKAIIAQLRESRADKRENSKRQRSRRRAKAHHRGGNEENRATIKSLLDKYKDDIQALMDEVKPQAELWKEDIQKILEKYRPDEEELEVPDCHPRAHAPMEGKGRKGPIRAAHFLLLDPSELTPMLDRENSGANPAFEQLSIYPNPATNSSNLQYELEEAGKVRIELRDEQGKTIQVLQDSYQQEGSYNLAVNTSELKDGVYYFTITNGKNVSTKKLIISK